MFFNTRGIIIQRLNYNDSSLIVKAFSELFGMQTYMVRGIRGKKTKAKIALLQPLTRVLLTVSHREKKQFQQLREINLEKDFTNLSGNPVKNGIILFSSEILYKSLREEPADPNLFSFLHFSLDLLDRESASLNEFPILFLKELCRYLGFFPAGIFSETNSVFDMLEGKFVKQVPTHGYYLEEKKALSFSQLLSARFKTGRQEEFSPSERRDLLKTLLIYFQLHVPGFKDVKSHLVLQEVLA